MGHRYCGDGFDMATQPPNWTEVQEVFYNDYYPQLASGGAQGWYHGFVHQQMEAPFGEEIFLDSVLEIGADDGEHLAHVAHQYGRYVMSDIRSWERPLPHRVEFVECEASSLPFVDEEFDRVL